MVEICARLYAKAWLAACDGNVSVRIDDEQILMTPSQRHKGFLRAEEMAVVALDGRVISGKPSSEMLMHLAIYQAVEKAQAVVHAHPPVATAWSIAFPDMLKLPLDACSEVIPSVGNIPIVPYQRPGTAAMGAALMPHLPEAHVMILARHGSISWGASLEEAFFGTERLEHAATTLMYAKNLGGITSLPKEEVEYLKCLRKKVGDRIV